MPKAPSALSSPKIKKLAKKAMQSPSMLTTAETRDLGASVMAFLSPPKDVALVVTKKIPAKKTPVKNS